MKSSFCGRCPLRFCGRSPPFCLCGFQSPSVSMGFQSPFVSVGFIPLWGFSPPSVSFFCLLHLHGPLPFVSAHHTRHIQVPQLVSPLVPSCQLASHVPHQPPAPFDEQQCEDCHCSENVDSGPDCEVACDCCGNIWHSSLSPLNFFPPSSHSTQCIQLPFESHPHSFTLQHHPVTATASQQRLSLPPLRFFWLPPPSPPLLFLTQ